jgi:hypothetical protein
VRPYSLEEPLSFLEDGLSFVATGGDVIDCTGVFYAKRAGHNGGTVAVKEVNVNSKDLQRPDMT